MNVQSKDSIRSLSIPVISCSSQVINPTLRGADVTTLHSDELIVPDIHTNSSRPSTSYISSENRKEIEYSIESLADSNLLGQGDFDESVIAVPIQLVQLSQSSPSSIPHSQSSSLSSQLPFSIGKNLVRESNITSTGFNAPIVFRSNSDGTKSIFIDATNINVSDGEGGILSLEHKLIEDSSSQSNLNEREVILQLDDDSTINFNQLAANHVMPPNVILSANGYHYVSSKEIDGTESQVFLPHTDGGGFDSAIAIDSIAGDSNLLSSQLMVTNLLKSDSNLDDKIPDTQTITIDRNHSARVLDDVDPPIGLGPWTCKRCGLTLDRWAQFKKHEKKHVEDKPYTCTKCSEAFNIKKNYELHMLIHNSTDLKCPECGKVFKRLASFKSHLVVHQEDEILFCEDCGDEFFTMNQLEAHKVMSHTGDPLSVGVHVIKTEPTDNPPTTFDCKKCSGTFNSALQLKNHSLLHKKVKKLTAKPRKKVTNRSVFEKKCTDCGKAFLKPSQLVRHMRIHTGERPFKCTYPGCERAFNQKGTMLIHMDIHYGKKSHKCDLCGKSFVQKSNLRGHMNRVHPLSKSDEPRYYCAECPCVFKRSNSLNAHVSRVHILETFVVPNSSKTSNDIQDVEKQVNVIENKSDHNMNTSGKDAVVVAASKGENGLENKSLSVVDGDILQQALKNSGLAQSKDVNGVKVEKLNDSDDERNLQTVKIMTIQDRVQEGNVRRYSVQVRLQGDTRWYICDFKDCKKEFKKPSDLVRHMRVHTHEKPYKCTKCARAFSIKATLMSHMKTHLLEKEFSCESCGKKFTTAASLKTHSWVHTGTKPYKCPLCPKLFRTISHRKAHMLSHSQSAYRLHNIKKKNMPLPDIPLQEPILITSEGLVKQVSRYNNVYSNEGNLAFERPHRCRFCSAAFKKSSHLKQHERMHTGEKPFKCENCFKTFSSQSVLKSHLKVHTGVRPYSCQTCLKEFSSRGSLKRHLTTHSSDRPYMCPYCHSKFKTNTNCKKHMKTHRQELAMNAIKAAGASLRGDNEQALLTASLYGNQHSLPLNNNNNNNNSNTNNNNNSNNSSNNNNENSNSVISQENTVDSNSSLQLSTALTQDLVEGRITLAEFNEKEGQYPAEAEIQVSESPQSHATSFILSNSSILPAGSKILLQGSNDGSSHQSINGIFIQPGMIFESYEYQTNSESGEYIIQGPQTYIQDKENGIEKIQVVSTKSNSFLDQSNVANSAPLFLKEELGNEEGKGCKTYRLIAAHSSVASENNLSKSKAVEFPTIYCSTNDLKSTSNSKERIEFQVMKEEQMPKTVLHQTKVVEQFKDVLTHSITEEDKVTFVRDVVEEVSAAEKEDLLFTVENETNRQVFQEAEAILSLKGSGKRKKGMSYPEEENEFEKEIEENRKRPRRKKDLQEQNEVIGVTVNTILHEGQNNIKSEEFECGICGKKFSKSYHLNNHLKTHKNQHKCRQCGDVVASLTELKEHYKDHNNKICSVCNLTFSSQSLLIDHVKNVHNVDAKERLEKQFLEAPEKNLWQCPVCKLFFTSAEGIQKHLELHPREEINNAVNKKKSESVHRSKPRLKIISNENTDTLMNSIDSSSKSDENVELYHQRKQETGRSYGMKTDLPNRCSTCGKGFKKPSDLVRHIRTHTGEKPFACKLCCKKFAVKSTLDVHLRTHTGKKEHKCNTCNIFYSSKGSLKIHMRLHTGSKPLQCYHCGLRFRTSGHRKTHMMKHGIIANTKDTGLIKKFKQEDSNESSGDVGEHSEMAEIVGGQTEAILPTTLDVSDDLEACNSVMVNLDGTVTLQLSGMNFNGLDASSLLSLHAVGLEDANLDPLQYGNTVSLEFPSEVIDERGETALQNVVMVQRENFVNNEGSKSIRDERRDLNITEQDQALISLEENLAAREDVDASSNHSSEYSQVLTTYLPVNSVNSEIKCPFCSKLFSKPSECQEHIQNLHSGIVKAEYIPVEMSYSPDPLALTLKQSLGPQRKITFKDKMYNFSSDKDYDFSRDTVPNLSFKCLICKEIFVSQSSYHQHLSTEHRCSELYKNSNQFCNEEYSRKEDLLSHQHHHHQQQSGVILSHPGVIFKNSTKSNIIKNSSDKSMTLPTASSSRSGIEEDIDPLMIRDIFLPQ